MRPGQAERKTHDHVRSGTTALDPCYSKISGQCRSQHRRQEFLRFPVRIDSEASSRMEMHLVLDNYAHTKPKVERWFKARPRCHLLYTPTFTLWLNQVERRFAKLTEHASMAYTEQYKRPPSEAFLSGLERLFDPRKSPGLL
jgi:hypothetical protein